ncbi:MAG TPA: sulfotransferase [Gaiellaceae bacterium]|nr:sulfotransferase [Gaiellaceae bacterium]
MRLIGAGLPRTATLSQKVALETLGLGPCYHMVDVLSDLGRTEQWTDALDGKADWDEIFEGYQSTVDWPGSYFYRELVEKYPDAKVLLSVRSGESWARSMIETISSILYGDSLMYDLSNARSRVDPGWNAYLTMMKRMWKDSGLIPDGKNTDAAYLASAMERYNEQVKSDVPDVLVWTAADGWEPLCEFLELDVPDTPFPRVNDSAMFSDRIVESALEVLNAWREQQVAAAT